MMDYKSREAKSVLPSIHSHRNNEQDCPFSSCRQEGHWLCCIDEALAGAFNNSVVAPRMRVVKFPQTADDNGAFPL